MVLWSMVEYASKFQISHLYQSKYICSQYSLYNKTHTDFSLISTSNTNLFMAYWKATWRRRSIFDASCLQDVTVSLIKSTRHLRRYQIFTCTIQRSSYYVFCVTMVWYAQGEVRMKESLTFSGSVQIKVIGCIRFSHFIPSRDTDNLLIIWWYKIYKWWGNVWLSIGQPNRNRFPK